MCAVRDDKYYARCSEIRELILRGYADKILLQTLDYQKFNGLPLRGNVGVARHLAELLKCDLALVIWKVYVDGNKSTNTLHNLVEKFLKGIYELPELSASSCKIKEDIIILRNTYLAHAGCKRRPVSVNMSDLYVFLDELKEMYNALCDKALDDRVEPIKESDIAYIDTTYFLGFLSMIQDGSIFTQDKEVTTDA